LGECSHAVARSLADIKRRAISQLLVDCLHEGVLVDNAGLAQNNQAISLEKICADIKALFLAVRLLSLLNTLEEVRVQSVDDAWGALFLTLVDDASDAQGEDVDGFHAAFDDVLREFVQDDCQVRLTDFSVVTMDAFHSFRLDLN
jgi:hypothetical protein